MALQVEGVVDGGVETEKALRGAGRLEPLHLALSPSGRLVRILCPVVQSFMLSMLDARYDLPLRRTAAVNALRGHLAEFGIIAAKGTAKARELMSLVATDERVPGIARDALQHLVEQIRDIERKIEAFDKQLLSLARQNEVCRRLMTILGIGPIAATALAATVGNPRFFTSGRHFAAWIGLVPKQHSSGGKERLGGDKKGGGADFRQPFVPRGPAPPPPGCRLSGAGVWVARVL